MSRCSSVSADDLTASLIVPSVRSPQPGESSSKNPTVRTVRAVGAPSVGHREPFGPRDVQ